MTVQTKPPPHLTETQCQQYLSCYRLDFDQTLKVDSWDHFELIPTVMATFVKSTFVLADICPGNICRYQEYLSCY